MSVNVVDKSTGNLTKVAGNAIEDAVGIHYSNSVTGLAATNVQGAVDELSSEKAEADIIATAFSAASTYTAGQYCIQDGDLYRFKTTHSGTWSASDVDAVTVGQEVTSLKSGLINVQSNLTGVLVGTDAVNTTHTVNSAYLTKNGMVIVCTAKLTLTSDITAWSNFARLNLVTFPDGFQFLCTAGGVIIPAFVTQSGNIQLTQGQTSGTEITMTFAAVSA